MSTRKPEDQRLPDDALEALFAEARAAPPAPVPEDLRARLIAAVPPPAGPVGSRVVGSRVAGSRVGWGARLAAFWAEIGGAPALAGVTAAGLAGVWIGFAAPGPAADLASTLWLAQNAEVAGLAFGGSDLLALLDSETE